MAGQFAKPRSASQEIVDGVELPVYRGDMVNSVEPDPLAGTGPAADADGLPHAAAKLNLIRSLSTGGFGGLNQVHAWNRDFVAASPSGAATPRSRPRRARLRFVEASRIGRIGRAWSASKSSPAMGLCCYATKGADATDQLTGDWFDTSAHMLWVGERTRALARRTSSSCRNHNPVACKLGPTATAARRRACERLTPQPRPGRLTLIAEDGRRARRDALPRCLRRARRRSTGHLGVRTDAANTVKTASGARTPLRGRAGRGRYVLRGCASRPYGPAGCTSS